MKAKKRKGSSPGYPGTVHKADCPCPVCRALRKEGYEERAMTALRLPVVLKAQIEEKASRKGITFTAATEQALRAWLEN
ncbi:MAG: hypothetical protein AB9903_02100 [Vulcanimicrobiota bacterium]